MYHYHYFILLMVTTHGHCLCNEHKIKKKKATVDLFLAHKFEGLGICTISRCKGDKR